MQRWLFAVALSLAPVWADCGQKGFGASGQWLTTIKGRCADSCCCASACAANDQCKAWQWISDDDKEDYHDCYLKSSSGVGKNAGSHAGQKPACGVQGAGASGQVLARVDSCATACCCQKACRDHTNCAAWQYMTDERLHDARTCYLKSSRTTNPNNGSTSGTIFRGTRGENCQWADNVGLYDDGRPYARLRYGVDQDTGDESVACVGRTRAQPDPNWATAFERVLPKLSYKYDPSSPNTRRRSSAMLKSLKAWSGADGDGGEGDCQPMGIVRLELGFFSDEEVYDIGSNKDAVTDGRIPGIGFTECELQPGQMFSKVSLGYNDVNGFSYINILDTTGKHACELGAYRSGSKCFKNHVHTVDFTDVDFGMFLAGVTATVSEPYAGGKYQVIPQFGFVFFKQPQKVEILDIWFPTFDSLTKVTNPWLVAQRRYCNDVDVERPTASLTRQKTVSNGQKHCFKRSSSSSFDYSFGDTISVTAEENCFFEKVSTTNTFEWKVEKTSSHSETQKDCSDTTSSSSQSLTFPDATIPAHTSLEYSFSQWQGEIHDLPYECTVHLGFEDGTEFYARNVTGMYSAATFLTVQEEWTGEEENVTHCEGTVIV